MNDLARFLIEHECTRVIHDYALFVDFVDPMEAARLITDDGALVLKSRSKTLSGRKEIDALYQNQKESQLAGRLLQRHFLSNIMIDVKDSDHAAGRALVNLYRSEWDLAKGPAPMVFPVLFRWEDDFVRTPEGWRISRHVVWPAEFESPEAGWSNPWGR